MKDITGAEYVEVSISANGKILWVNVDGVCALRVCKIKNPVRLDVHQQEGSPPWDQQALDHVLRQSRPTEE